MGTERRRRRLRRSTPEAVVEPPRVPSPQDLAGLNDTFAMTAGIQDPDPAEPTPEPVPAEADKAVKIEDERPAYEEPAPPERTDDPQTERGLRGLVGGGSSQVSVSAALRARDAARPTADDLAAADTELVIVRRGWVPREDLPARGPRRT